MILFADLSLKNHDDVVYKNLSSYKMYKENINQSKTIENNFYINIK